MERSEFPLRRYGGAVWARCNVRKLWKCCRCRTGLPSGTECWFVLVENIKAGYARNTRVCQRCMRRLGTQPRRGIVR